MSASEYRQTAQAPKHGAHPFRSGNGKAAAWIFDHENYEKDGCLQWPFARAANGYGSLSFKGVRKSAHRMMCEAAHGGAPTNRHLACHSCGNGHMGCVNPRHLYWGTDSENMMDKVSHGTDSRGEKHYQAKLSEYDVLKIRSLRGIISEAKISKTYGVGRTTIADIMHRRTWAWL